MSTKPRLSIEGQIRLWFSTAQTDAADALLAEIKGIIATRRKQSRSFVKKVKANSAKAVHKTGHEGALAEERPQ